MQLQRVQVKGLFGLFDHEVTFPPGESVVIIHGPNGLGKTAVLRMIGALVSGHLDVFQQLPFKEFILEFDDGSKRWAYRPESDNNAAEADVELYESRPGSPPRPITQASKLPAEILDYIDRYVPAWVRFRDGWRDDRGRPRSVSDVLARFPSIREQLPASYRRAVSASEMENFRLFFVETNRLFVSQVAVAHDRYFRPSEFGTDPDEPAIGDARSLRVVQYSRDLTRRIHSVLASYAKHSQESDRTFPERLVHFLRNHEPALTEREILAEMGDLEESRQRLINLGFLDTETGLTDLTEEDVRRAREALTIYVKDVREKFRVFADMSKRVGMLTDIINDRFRYKVLTIDREQGFKLHSSHGAQRPVSLDSLSSGEQHELVLLYELLFLVPRNGLVLIDEPEISLHVGWQSRFLRDLIDILSLTGARAIVATHAPAIIGTRWDLTVQLGGPSDDSEDDVDAATV